MRTLLITILTCTTVLLISSKSYASGNAGGGSGGSSAGAGGAGGGQLSNDSSAFKVEEARKRLRERIKKKRLAQNKSINFDHNFPVWSKLLSSFIVPTKDGKSTQVDYQNFDLNKLQKLTAKWKSLSQEQFNTFSKQQKLAFIINLYNAKTIEVIISSEKFKSGDIKSIKDLNDGFPSFTNVWQKKRFVLFGEPRSLDDLEHAMVRGSKELMDPRIHFAFNCASIGCPALYKEPFIGSKIDSQLEDATKLFLSDRSRNRFENNRLYLSEIFKWYESDFSIKSGQLSTPKEFIKKYINVFPQESRSLISKGDYDISYLDYDWNLNSKDRVQTGDLK